MKTFTDEKGQLVITLPVAGTELTFRSPKGRDLKAIEVAAKAEDATNIGVMMVMASVLCASQELTVEELEDMDAEDVATIGQTLSSFRAFRKFAA